MKTFKTWEIWKDAKDLEGRRFTCIKPQNSIVKKGDTLKLINFANCPGLAEGNEIGAKRVIGLTGFEEWELVQEPIKFMEATEAYYKRKVIWCEISGTKNIYDGSKHTCGMIDQNGNAVSPREILEGKWFIQEDAE